MQTETPKNQKRETAQEAFKRLREQERLEMLEKNRQIEDAQDRARAAVAKKRKKRGKDKDNEQVARPVSVKKEKENSAELAQTDPTTVPTTGSSPTTTESETPGDVGRTSAPSMESQRQRHRKGRGDCANCCGGLPGKGPKSARDNGRSNCCCSSERRSEGAGDASSQSERKASRSFSESRGRSEDSRVSQRSENRRCGRCSSRASIMVNHEKAKESNGKAKRCGGWTPPFDGSPTNEERLRGGCGACEGSTASISSPRFSPPSTPYRKQTEFRACHETTPPAREGGGCPCGGCGGPACSDNPGGGGADGGCCGRNRPRGKACKCKCQSCDSFRPLGGCGGQSCGRIYSCAGSGGGRCCFPRNHKRRSGPDCCGGANASCGGCC